MKVKKFLSLALCGVLASCIGLSACGEGDSGNGGDDTDKPTPVQLTAPQITLTENVISWTAVKDATGYDVYEGETKVTSQTATSYTIMQTTVGSYVYTVYATSTDTEHFTKSKVSNSVTYKVENIVVEPTQLTAPQISLSENVISWTAVENATGYEVYKGDTLVITSEKTSYTINETEAGKYDFTVYAISSDTENFSKSPVSNKVTYTVRGEVQSVTLDASKKIYVVGDSTVCDFQDKDDYYIRRYGYGTQLYNFLDLTNASQVVNLALSGRSSKSFLTESNYTTLKNSIGAGDFLIIGFGHNDEKSDDPARFTDPNGDYTVKGSFQNTLYESYVKLATDKGATPILCTPIVRYSGSGYDGSVAHVTSAGDYPAAIKKLGADTNTAVVDLTAITKEYYSAHNDEAKKFHAYTSYIEDGANKNPDGMDGTHINKYGAKQIALWLLDNLPAECPLVNHVKIEGELDASAEYAGAINGSYVKPPYDGFNPAQYASNKLTTTTTNDTTVDWYHTAMGIIGGDSKTSEYKFTENNGVFTITAGSGSKFASGKADEGTNGQDGFGAMFVQVDITKDFKATAKAKVTTVSASDQSVFGMMLRDDIYIDKHNTTINSNFVSASVTGKGKANMSRDNKVTLSYGGSMACTQNAEYELSLTRVGQVVTAVVKQGTNTVTSTFTDYSFVGVDSTKMYLCLFVSRSMVVEFSEISFEITGEAQGA